MIMHNRETGLLNYGYNKRFDFRNDRKCFEMIENAFYFILKALFVFKIFKFLLRLFGQVGKTA